jgi:F-type H+-transporting ATPase subunit b
VLIWALRGVQSAVICLSQAVPSRNFMDATLHALGQVLLQGLPTFFLVLFLHFYLRSVFFKPLGKILHERKEATEGARKQAAQSLERAAAKAAAYEESIRAARSEIYQEQDVLRRKWRDEQSAQISDARKRAEVMVKSAKTEIAGQMETARQSLASSSQTLADQITEAVLQRRAH